MDLTQPLAITPIQPISEEQQVVLEKQLGHSVNDVDDIKQLIESALQQYEHIGAASGISLDLSLPREEGISLPSKLLGRVLSDDAEKVANQQSPLQVAVKQVVAKSRQRWLACDYNSALLSLLTVSEYMVILYRKQKDFGILGPEHSVHPLYYGYRSHNPYSRKETVMTSLLQILNKVWVEYMISYPLSASSRMQWAEKLAEWGSLFSDAIPLAKNGWEDPNLKEIMNRATIIETTSDVEPQDEEFNVDMETDDRIASLLENVDSSDPESTLLRSVSKYMLTKRAQDRERANLANSNESDQIHPVLKESKEVLLTRIHYLLSKGLFTQSLNLSRSAGVVIGEAMSLIYMNHIQEGVLVALNKVEAVYDLYSLIHILKEHCPFGVFEIGTKLLKLLATRPKNTPDDAPYWKRAETEISATLTHNGKDIQLTPVSLAEFMIHYAHQKSHASEEPPVTTEKEGSTSMELEKAKLANVDSLTRLCARKVAIAYIEEPPHERFELLSSLAPELQSLIMIELLSLKLPDVLPSKDLTHCAKLFNKLGEYQVCFHLLVKSISAPPGSSDSSKVVLSNPIASDTLMWAADLACSFPGEREAFALAKELNKQATKSNLFRIAHAVGLSTYMLPGSCRGPTNVLNAKQLFDVARIFYRSKKYQASLAAAAGCFRVRRTYRYSYTIHSQDADKLQVLAWIIVRLLPVVDKREDPIKTIVTQLLSSKVPSTMLYFVHYLLEMNKMEEDPECIVQHKQQIQQLIERSLRCKKGIGRNFFELAQELHRHGDKVNALKLAIKSYGLRGFFQTSMPLPYGRERSETAVTPKNAYDWVLVHLEQLTDEELEQVCESRKFILSERTLAFAVAKILEKRQFVDIAAEIALRSLDIPHTMMSTRPASSLGEIVAWLLVLLSEHPEVTESTRTRVKLLEPEALEKKCEELLNSSDCFVVSRNLYELGNKAGAFKLGQRALACSPRSIEIAEWLGTLAVELGQPVTAQITALVLFQEKPSLAHYKLLKERGVPSEKIEFLLMKVSKSTKDIGILEVLLQKLMWDDAFAFVDRFECNPKALKFLFEKLETSNNNNNNKNSTKLSISNSLRKELLQRCIQRLETFLFSFHWQNQGDIEENVFIMQELLPKYAPDLIEYFNCIQVVSRSINTLSASNAQYVRLITELESLYKILEKGGKYHVWRDIVDYVKAKHKLKKKLISMMNVKNW